MRSFCLISSAFGLAACVSAVAEAAPPKKTTLKQNKPAYHFPETGPLSIDDLVWASISKRKFQKTDEFSEPFDEKFIINRQIKIDIPVKDSFSSIGRWKYDQNSNNLKLIIEPSHLSYIVFDENISQKKQIFRGFKLLENFSKEKTSVGTNAFGARIIYDTYRNDSFSVGYLDNDNNNPLIKNNGEIFVKSIKINPADARILVSNLKVVVEGVITPANSKLAINCGGHYNAPNFDNKVESYGSDCVINVKFSRIAFESNDNSIVAEWTIDKFSQPVTVVDPKWTRAPHAELPYAAKGPPYSAKALSGSVKLRCTVRGDSFASLENCKVIDEEPKNMGFGDAAISAARWADLDPKQREGYPLVKGSYVEFVVNFPINSR
jgi:hypothetical protein